MYQRLIIAALILSLLTGSAAGQQKKSRKPVVQTPETFRGDSEQAVASAQQSLADLKWFEVFRDEQLQELIRTALVENYDLREVIARVNAARANLGITRSEQFPSIAAGADLTTLRNSASGSFPSPQGFKQKRTFGGVLLNLLSFEIDIWGRKRRQTEAARRTAGFRGGSQSRHDDAGRRCRGYLLQPARAGHGDGDCEAHALHS